MAVAILPGPALGDSLELPHLFSKWSVASERYNKSEWDLEGSAGRGRAATARGQVRIFRLKPLTLKRVDESASRGQGHLFLACVQGRLLEVIRGMERGLCNTGQFRKFVDFLKTCASCLPSPHPTRTLPGFCMTTCGLAVEFVSIEVITGMVLEAGSACGDRRGPGPCACQSESQEVGPRGGDGFQESGARLFEGPCKYQYASFVR